MDFEEKIKKLGSEIIKNRDHIKTEQATKSASVMPFFQILGYNVFDPLEFVPEYVADIGIKKGEKVDYAVLSNEEPIIIIECKNHSKELNIHSTQLQRYFYVTQARLAILTNGIIYRFYSDLVEFNKMDDKPFLEFDITNINDFEIFEIKKFQKSIFNLEEILKSAKEIQNSYEIKEILIKEFNNPSKEFVKFIVKQISSRTLTLKILNQFTPIVKKTIYQVICEIQKHHLKLDSKKESKLDKKKKYFDKIQFIKIDRSEKTAIVSYDKMTEGFYIVKSILRKLMNPGRIHQRNTKKYLSILLDNTNSKPICRLYLNSEQTYLSIFDRNKKEIKYKLMVIDDIYDYEDIIINKAASYLKKDKNTDPNYYSEKSLLEAE
jgi:predicted type IV restriction endonuclease